MSEVVGERPNESDRFWKAVGDRYDPEKTLERLDSQGKFLFSSVSAVGGLFALATVAGVRLGGAVPMALAPVVLCALSLALAMMGLRPRVSSMSAANLSSVRDYYNEAIRRRGRYTAAAALCFAGAILSTAIVVAWPANPRPRGGVWVSTEEADGKLEVHGKIEYEDLPRAAEVRTRLVTVDENPPVMLYEGIFRAGDGGKVAAELKVPVAAVHRHVRLICELQGGGGVHPLGSAEIDHARAPTP